MYPLSKRLVVAASLFTLAACGRDVGVNPVDSFEGTAVAATSTTDAAITASYRILVGQKVTIKPKTTSRLNRLKWASSRSSVATVNNNGQVSGLSGGEALVTLTGSGVYETYQVTVESPATVTSFDVQPATGTALVAGQTRQFTTSAVWSDLVSRPVTVTYTATGGTISSSGFYTAGQIAGSFLVIANCGCGKADTAAVQIQATVIAPTLTSLVISPATATVQPGASQQFSASALWSNGGTTLPTIVYSATGGTVNASGQYVAPTTAGTYRVILAQSGGTASDTAVVTVPAPQLTSLKISPKTVSVAAGATQQFGATANWSTGATTLPPVTYSTDLNGGTVTTQGLYTAPATSGTYRVYLAHTGGTLRDTATVTVTGGTTGDGSTGGGTTQPPAGTANVLFSDSFESGGFATTQNGVKWTDASWVDATSLVARSGTKSARFRQGESKDWTELRFGGLPSLNEAYVQFWLYQPNGTESPSLGIDVKTPGTSNDKFFRLWGGSYSGANDIKYGFSTWSGKVGTEYKRNGLNGTMWGMGEGGDPIAPDVSTYHSLIGNPVYKGRWVKVQIRAKTAASGQDNGILQLWLDGVLVINRQKLRSYAAGTGANVFQSGYLLGWANNGFPSGQYMYLDDFSISTSGFPQ